jgi:hypothetical protein
MGEEIMKMCLCVKPELAESQDGFAFCKNCGHWFNSGLWKKHWAKKVDSAIEKNKIGRNDPCPCKSGKKYKKCCQPVGHRRWITRNGTPHEKKSIAEETIIERERRIENETDS